MSGTDHPALTGAAAMPVVTAQDHAFWRDDLDPAEALAWTGRPAPEWHFNRDDVLLFLAGVAALCLLGLVCIGVVNSIRLAQDPPALPILSLMTGLGIALLLLGLYGTGYLLYGRLRARERELSVTRYAVTSIRPDAMVRGQSGDIAGGRALSRVGGRWPRFQSWPITARTIIECHKARKTGHEDIHLADEIWRDSDGDQRHIRLGFRRIKGGAQLVSLLRKIQFSCNFQLPVTQISDEPQPNHLRMQTISPGMTDQE